MPFSRGFFFIHLDWIRKRYTVFIDTFILYPNIPLDKLLLCRWPASPVHRRGGLYLFTVKIKGWGTRIYLMSLSNTGLHWNEKLWVFFFLLLLFLNPSSFLSLFGHSPSIVRLKTYSIFVICPLNNGPEVILLMWLFKIKLIILA